MDCWKPFSLSCHQAATDWSRRPYLAQAPEVCDGPDTAWKGWHSSCCHVATAMVARGRIEMVQRGEKVCLMVVNMTNKPSSWLTRLTNKREPVQQASWDYSCQPHSLSTSTPSDEPPKRTGYPGRRLLVSSPHLRKWPRTAFLRQAPRMSSLVSSVALAAV